MSGWPYRLPRTSAIVAPLLLVALLGAACSSGRAAKVSGQGAATTARTGPASQVSRPPGPAATIGGPLTGGKGIALVAANTGPPLAKSGYTESEYTAAGSATSYRATSGLPTDGTYQLAPDSQASYETRIVVRRPSDPAKFNGTVVVEWLNVSGGADTAPEYTYLATGLLRDGYAWVGVSAQRIGVEGGAVAVQVPGASGLTAGGLKGQDPVRYGALHHPGDAYSYDIYTQVARALRAPATSIRCTAWTSSACLPSVSRSQPSP